jgi:hypothetical protein
MTGKLRLNQRDWLWAFDYSRWKSRKSDWLNLNLAVVREATRFGKRDLHFRNLKNFRELRREMRFERGQKKLGELWNDENSVLGHVGKPSDTILKSHTPVVTWDETLAALGTHTQLGNDILRLLDKLSGSTGDINALWRVIETAGHIGRFMGEVSYQRKLRTEEGRKTISAKVQRRQEIVRPLILAEAKINPKAVSKRTFEKANELLIANGEKPVGKRTFDDLVSAIIAEAKTAK